MKKIIILSIVLLSLISCDKKKNIVGDRENILFDNTNLQLDGNTNEITINTKSSTYQNYYGSYSTLNTFIDNYQVDNFNFNYLHLAAKKWGVDKYIFSNPIIVDNILYYIDTNGNLIAKNISNKNILWQTKIIDKHNFINYYAGKLSYYNDNIYITTRLNDVISINKDGTVNWKKTLNAIPISTPVIEDDNIYIITNDNKTYSLSTYDGQINWIHYGNVRESAILGSSNVVIYNDYIISSYSSGALFVLNKNTGEQIYTTNLSGKYFVFSNFELNDIDLTPIIYNNILVASANNGMTIAFNLDTMQIIWKKNLSSLTNILSNNGFLYIMSTDNILYCLNIDSGKIYWKQSLNQYVNMEKKKEPIIYPYLSFINNKIYAFNNKGEYKTFDSITGNIEDEKKINIIFYDTPFSLNNRLYGIILNGSKIQLLY